jgi:hypothetical protein
MIESDQTRPPSVARRHPGHQPDRAPEPGRWPAYFQLGIATHAANPHGCRQNHLRTAPDASTTLGLTAEHARALLAAASAHSLPMQALVALLLVDGLRISEALAVCRILGPGPDPSRQCRRLHTPRDHADDHRRRTRPGPEAVERPVAPLIPGSGAVRWPDAVVGGDARPAQRRGVAAGASGVEACGAGAADAGGLGGHRQGPAVAGVADRTERDRVGRGDAAACDGGVDAHVVPRRFAERAVASQTLGLLRRARSVCEAPAAAGRSARDRGRYRAGSTVTGSRRAVW